MKILTWNINGIRATKEPLKQILDSLESDIICLQETKITRDLLDEQTALVEGYNSYYSYSRGKTGYSGVAIYCKDHVTPVKAEEGLTGLLTEGNDDSMGCYGDQTVFNEDEIHALDNEGRCVITQHQIRGEDCPLVIINVYCPRADPENEERQLFKLKFYKLLQIRAEALVNAGCHVIVLGDVNTSHRPIDVGDPDEEDEFMAKPAHQWLDQFLCDVSCDNALEDQSQSSNNSQSQSSTSDVGENVEKPAVMKKKSSRGRSRGKGTKSAVSNFAEYVQEFARTKPGLFVDSFRYFHPKQKEAYSCWCSMTGARKLNFGTRIDYILPNKELLDQFQDCYLMPDFMGSDHCPVRAEIDIVLETAAKPPSVCTKYLQQFSAKQRKLVDFFSAGTKPVQKSPIKTTSPRKATSPRKTTSPRKACESVSSGTNILDTLGKKRTMPNAKNVPSKKPKLTSSNSGSKQTSLFSMFCPKPSKQESPGMVLESKTGSGKPGDGLVERTESLTSEAGRESVNSDSHSNLGRSEDGSTTLGVGTNSSDSGDSKSSDHLGGTTESCDKTSTQSGESKKANVSAWKGLFKGPPPAPLCSGHKEPCLLRTVKKDSLNKGRQFWVCNRPDGHSHNPEAKCNYFKWVSDLKKSASK